MPKLSFDALSSSQLWTLQNRDVELDIEKSTGWIRGLRWRRGKGVDLFEQTRAGIPGYIGGLTVHDERDDVWYRDMDGTFRVTKPRKSGNKVSFHKTFTNAPFTLRITLQLQKDALVWQVQAEKKNRKVADRSLAVYFRIPAIAGWNVWAPCKAGEEFTFDGMTEFSFHYCQNSWVSDNDIILPAMSHYNKALDVGVTLMNPIDAQVPASKFQFSNAGNNFFWGGGGGGFERDPKKAPYLEVVNYAIGLVGDRAMDTQVMMMFHEGGWRPGLGKIYNRWQEFFDPANPTMYDYEGVFTCSSVELDMDAAREAHLKTMEVHDHFEHYGRYFNTKSKWMKNSIKEGLWKVFGGKKGLGVRAGKSSWEILQWIDSHSDREIAEKAYSAISPVRRMGLPDDVGKWTDEQVDEFIYRTHDRIHERLQKARKNGIEPFWYFNYTDGFRPMVEENWPDAICRYENGEYIPSGWQMCHNMNADPKYSFGKYIVKCARKIVEEYPEIRGFFLDCFRHYEIDFGHDDGITVVNHKPAYSINFSYDEVEARVKKILHDKNLCTFANKPQTMRIMRWCDGMMLEGNGDQFEEKYFWSAIAMPIIFLWTTNANSIDENYRRSILHGCYPKMVHQGKYSKKDLALLDRYMPLFDQFRRRVLCFEADPIRVPDGSRAKLFTTGKDYVAGIINTNVDEGDRIRYHGTPHAVFRVKRGPAIGKVGVMYPGDKKFRKVDFHFDGTFIFVPMEEYTNCAVVKLFVTRKTRKTIKSRPFPTVIDYCGDPESAFSDLGSL